jgi:hypothetical protein
MRIESSVVSVSWIPREAIAGLTRIPFDTGVAHYDPPPPTTLDDLEAMRQAGRFRFANELRAWIEVVDGRITGHGHLGRGYLSDTTLKIGKNITFRAVAFPDIRPDPEVKEGSVRFSQTAGGRTGVAAPRLVDRPPYVQLGAPVVWTTLALTIHTDGSSDYEVVGASPFPRHWIYDHERRHVAKTGLIDFQSWWRESFGSHTPWGGIDSPALIRSAVTPVEQEVSALLMDRSPAIRHLRPQETLVRQGDPGEELFLLLDGLLAVEVNGQTVAELAPGAVLGELALLEGGKRQATLRALTPVRVACVRGDRIDRESLESVARRGESPD